ncbi:MAG: flagellar hook-associated protein FlgK [Actinomycetota bacterium]
MPDFVALNTALSALRTARVRIDIASHNVANASTPGYTRQRVDQHPNPVFQSQVGAIGTGVSVSGIGRIRDGFLDARVRTASSTYGQFSIEHDLLDRAEQILAEPDEGITSRLSDLWASFEELALAPANTGARIAALGALEDLSARIRSVAEGWDRLADDVANHMSVRVDEVNNMLRGVADLNRQINENIHGGMPNDLMDQRDVLLDQLATAIGATSTPLEGNMVRVSLNGLSLVDGIVPSKLQYAMDPLTKQVSIVHPSGGMKAGGEIGGYQTFINVDKPALLGKLNDFVSDFVTALNAQHQAGYSDPVAAGGPGVAGGPLFNLVPGEEARKLTVAITDASQLAVSSDPGPPFPVNNGVNAQALADIRTQLTANGGKDSLDEAMRALVVELGAKVSVAKRGADSQEGLLSAAEIVRDSHHGVSLDEELTLLMEAEHSYQAAARVMSAVDEALDVLINRTGIVGR